MKLTLHKKKERKYRKKKKTVKEKKNNVKKKKKRRRSKKERNENKVCGWVFDLQKEKKKENERRKRKCWKHQLLPSLLTFFLMPLTWARVTVSATSLIVVALVVWVCLFLFAAPLVTWSLLYRTSSFSFLVFSCLFLSFLSLSFPFSFFLSFSFSLFIDIS